MPIRATNSGISFSGDMAPDMVSIPVKRMPKPMITIPMCWISFFLKAMIITMPMKTATGASTLIFRPMRKLVTVVPMLAPMMI